MSYELGLGTGRGPAQALKLSHMLNFTRTLCTGLPGIGILQNTIDSFLSFPSRTSAESGHPWAKIF